MAAAAAAALVWGDLAWRARVAYGEGEKHLLWHERRELQRAYWDGWLQAEDRRLAAEEGSGRMTPEERRLRGELARVEHAERVAENPLKYAVRWFETAAEQFSPPPSPWSRRAAVRLAEVRSRWRREASAAGLRPDEYRYR